MGGAAEKQPAGTLTDRLWLLDGGDLSSDTGRLRSMNGSMICLIFVCFRSMVSLGLVLDSLLQFQSDRINTSLL